MRTPERSANGSAVPLYVFAVASGAAALVYEVAWTKMLALTFGRSILAASAVIAAFMGGMGIGARAYHLALRRVRSALRLYAALELGIGVCGAGLTLALTRFPEVFAGAAAWIPAGLAMDLFRVGFVLLALLLPAALMGATYPALCSALIHSRDSLRRHLGTLYGLNTVGGAAGALLAGMVLVEHLGLRGSVFSATAVNLAVAAGAWRLGAREPTHTETPAVSDAEALLATRLSHRISGLVLFGSGFATLAYEIIWFRALRYLFGNSTYAFTVMLVVFLTGLGLGGTLFRRVSRRGAPERDLGFCQLGIALFALCAISGEAHVLGNEALEARVSIFFSAVFALAWWQRLLLDAGVALAIMLPATLLMGLSFPLATRLYLGDLRRLGARVGESVLLANAGSIAGALVAALWILPRLGSVAGTRAVSLLNLALGLLVLFALRAQARSAWRIGLAAATAVLAIGALLPIRLSFQGDQMVASLRGALIFEEEGDLATVQVWANQRRPRLRVMTIDGAGIGASAGWNYPLYSKQLLLAHLPMALDSRIRHTLNVGLGSASTLDALASYPSVETLDVVEISHAVVGASKLFKESEVLSDPRTRLTLEDASHFLLSTRRSYDLIVSDGKQGLDFSGNSALLCREFYQRALGRLSPDGLFVQWIPMATPTGDVRVAFRTFAEVFPEFAVFVDAPHSILMVGSQRPLAGRPHFGPEEFASLRARRDLARLRIPSQDALLALWVAGGKALVDSLGPGPISSWNRTWFEFSAYKATPADWARAPLVNLAMLLGAGRRALAAGESPPTAPDSPFVSSTALVREALLAEGGGDRHRYRLLLERAVQANPQDVRARSLLERSRVRPERVSHGRASANGMEPRRPRLSASPGSR